MAFDPKVIRRVLADFSARRARNGETLEARRTRAYESVPRIAEIDAALLRLMAGVVRTALGDGGDARGAAQTAARLRSERAALLKEHFGTEDYLDEHFECERCRDHGYIGPEPCICLQNAVRLEQNRELSRVLDMSRSFDDFRLDYYADETDSVRGISPRENMESIRDYLIAYAEGFREGADNVFINGPAGLGKTLLCACVARVAAERGFSVVYVTAYALFEHLEADRFGRDMGGTKEEKRRYAQTDLLILDDLGTELTTPLTVSILYNLINQRLTDKKSTIINTNLAMDELERRYSMQTASRLKGEYEHLALFGEDIRQKRRREYNTMKRS